MAQWRLLRRLVLRRLADSRNWTRRWGAVGLLASATVMVDACPFLDRALCWRYFMISHWLTESKGKKSGLCVSRRKAKDLTQSSPFEPALPVLRVNRAVARFTETRARRAAEVRWTPVALRTGTAGSQGESRCSAIHKQRPYLRIVRLGEIFIWRLRWCGSGGIPGPSVLRGFLSGGGRRIFRRIWRLRRLLRPSRLGLRGGVLLLCRGRCLGRLV